MSGTLISRRTRFSPVRVFVFCVRRFLRGSKYIVSHNVMFATHVESVGGSSVLMQLKIYNLKFKIIYQPFYL